MSVMKPSERARIAAAQRRHDSLRGDLERAVAGAKPPPVPRAVKAARASAELAAFGRRVTPQYLEAIGALHSRGGWPAVAQALAGAGLSADTIAAAGATVARVGLPGLSKAVAQQIQHEDVANLQSAASQDAVAVLASLSPADYAEAARIYNAGGPEALAQRAVELGLHPAVATVAVRTLETHGVEGTQQVVAQHVQARAQQAAAEAEAQAVAEKWTPSDGDSRHVRGIKEASPFAAVLRDPGFLAAAEGLARNLAAAGLERPSGMSTAEWVLASLDTMDGGRVMDAQRKPFDPSWSEDRKLSAAAQILGKSPGETRSLLDAFETAREAHGLVDRMARTDAKRPPAPKAPPVDGVRSAVEAATAKHGGTRERVGVGTALGGTIALAAGHKPSDVTTTAHADRDLEREANRLESPPPEPGSSVRAALENAIAVHADEERETNE